MNMNTPSMLPFITVPPIFELPIFFQYIMKENFKSLVKKPAGYVWIFDDVILPLFIPVCYHFLDVGNINLSILEILLDIWGLCSRKGGNCREKSNLCLYARYDFWAEISSDLALTQFLFFPAVSPFSTAKAPYMLLYAICHVISGSSVKIC